MPTLVFHEGRFTTVADVEFATAGWGECRRASLDEGLGRTTIGGFARYWGLCANKTAIGTLGERSASTAPRTSSTSLRNSTAVQTERSAGIPQPSVLGDLITTN